MKLLAETEYKYNRTIYFSYIIKFFIKGQKSADDKMFQ